MMIVYRLRQQTGPIALPDKCNVFMFIIMFIALLIFVDDFVGDFVVAPERMR
jgi:hypothetical protein